MARRERVHGPHLARALTLVDGVALTSDLGC